MKKSLILAILAIFLFSFVSSELTCPTGQINDTYPGDCGLYTDTNKDNICDYSQETAATTKTLNETELHDLISGQEIKTKTVGEVAEVYGICKTEYSSALSQKYGFLITSGENFSDLHEKGVQPSVAKEIAESLLVSGKTENETINNSTTPKKEYYFWQIALISSLAYLSSLYLVKKGKITTIQNRKFWNMLLLISFIITAITSIFILLRLNYGINLPSPINNTFWHIELGLVMILISIYHTLWHIPYFKSYFKK